MAWREAVVEVAQEAAEVFSDALLDAGAVSVTLEDASAGSPAEQPVFGEPGSDGPSLWARTVVRILVGDDIDVAALVAKAAASAGCAVPVVPLAVHVPAKDWVRVTQAQFVPLRISSRLWVVPSWHLPPEPAALNISLDPGLAFGTGSHATTRLCLEWLEQRLCGGDRVVDYGCGSGILAIAAAKLGAGEIVGVDIDPNAVSAARANAAHNGVAARFQDGAEPLTMQADVLVANILASPLKVLAPLLAEHVRSGGLIALAGLLTAQAGEIGARYQTWFEMSIWAEREGWALLEGRKR